MPPKPAPGLMGALKRWAWNASGFKKYGLKYHDCFYETEEVAEALRRLPQEIQDERNFRIVRAMQYSMMKQYLPQEQWTKYEEDDYYLKPYIEEVEREKRERQEWARK